MHYLDTSVLAAYYCPETLTSKVQKAVSLLTGPTISPLVEVELHSALSMKVRSKVLRSAAAGQVASMFQVHLADGRYRVVSIGAGEYALARTWLSTFDSPLRTLDALHLAAAFSNDLMLVSGDRNLICSAKQFGVKHQLIA